MASIFSIILIICTLIYSLTLILLLMGLFRLKNGENRDVPTISVIIPARNEAENIRACLEALIQQTYSPDRLELVIVDDRSTDGTARIVQEFVDRYDHVKLVKIGGEKSSQLVGKKNAINAGIQASIGEIILGADADCTPSPKWVSAMVSYFQSDVGVVGGYIYTETASEQVPHWQRIRSLERLGVVAVAAGTMGWGLGVTCTAGNLAYRRAVFEAIRGFSAIGQIRSGDDDLFIQQISHLTKWKFCYATDPESYVRTKAPLSIQQAWNQEQRRSSKGKYYPIWLISLLIPVFLMNIGFLIALITGFWWRTYGAIAICCFIFKALCELLVMTRTSQIFKRWDLLPYFLPIQLLYVPYFVIFAVIGSLGNYQWKN